MNRWTWVALVALLVVVLAGYLTLSRSKEPPTGMNDGFEDFKVEEFEAVDTDATDAADVDDANGVDVYDMSDDGAALPAPEPRDNDPMPSMDEDDAEEFDPEPLPPTDDDEGNDL